MFISASFCVRCGSVYARYFFSLRHWNCPPNFRNILASCARTAFLPVAFRFFHSLTYADGSDISRQIRSDPSRPALISASCHQIIIFRIPVLDQRTLHGLLMRICRQHRPAAWFADQARCSTCRSRSWTASGKSPAPAPAYSPDPAETPQAPQLPLIVDPGWELIRYGTRYCFFPSFSVHGFVLFHKFTVNRNRRFSHHFQAPASEICSGATLSCPLTWCSQSSRKNVSSLSASKIIKPDARTDKDLLYFWKRTQFLQQSQHSLCDPRSDLRMVSGTDTAGWYRRLWYSCFLHAGCAEIRGRPAHIMDVAFKIPDLPSSSLLLPR